MRLEDRSRAAALSEFRQGPLFNFDSPAELVLRPAVLNRADLVIETFRDRAGLSAVDLYRLAFPDKRADRRNHGSSPGSKRFIQRSVLRGIEYFVN